MARVTSSLETYGRNIKLVTADLNPQALAAALAKFAREELQAAIASGEASKNYEVFVNGRRGVSEDSVVPPGPILYVFGYWTEIIQAALDELRRRVPTKSGRYAGSFVVLADGKRAQNFADISSQSEVVIFNAQPYTRKMEVGANKTGAKHFDGASRAIKRQFKGTVTCETQYLAIAGGLAGGVPYVLRGSSAASHARRVRRDRRPGQPITYPALVMNLEP